MTKKILIFLMVGIFLLVLTGCQTEENKELIERYEAQAIINSKNYLKDKYNITAEVTGVKAYLNCEGFFYCFQAPPSGNVKVTFHYKDVDFDVFINGNKETLDGTDNYQYDTIKNDVENYFKNFFNNEPQEIVVDLTFYPHGSNMEYGIKELYHSDGIEMFKYIQLVKIYFLEKDSLELLELDSLTDEIINGEVLLLNFKSKEDYLDFKGSNGTLNFYFEYPYNSGYIYTKDIMKISYHYSKYYSFENITNYEDEIYIYLPRENRKIDVDVIIPDNISNYTESHELLKGKEIQYLSKSFAVKCNKQHFSSPRSSNIYLYIYFDRRKLKINDINKVFFATSWYENGIKKYLVEYDGYDYNNGNVKKTNLYYFYSKAYFNCDEDTDIVFSLISIS